MKEYEIKTASSYSFLGLLILIVLGFGVIDLIVHIDTKREIIPFMIVTAIVGWFIIKKFATGRVFVCVSNDKLEVEWVKKPFFSTQKNASISASSITGWRYIEDRAFDVLKIYLPDRKDVRIGKYNAIDLFEDPMDDDWEPDNFYLLIEEIEQFVEKENKRREKENKEKLHNNS